MSKFVAIAALHSEILLVSSATKQLYSWSCEEGGVVSAKPHPLAEELGLTGERVVLVASSDVRASLVTESGKMCTFYDRLLSGAYNNQKLSETPYYSPWFSAQKRKHF